VGIRWKLLSAFATIIVVYLSAAGPAGAPKFSDWSPPVLVPNVNSGFDDLGPAISRDGRSLYFHSTRPGGVGSSDIWVSRRASRKHPWQPPINLGPAINTAAAETVPAFSRDGHWMFFNSDRPGGSGLLDLWVSWRPRTNDDFGWTTPMNLGPNVNSSAQDAGPSYLVNRERDNRDGDDDQDENDDADGVALLFFGSTRPPGSPTNFDLYVSAQNSDGSFSLPTILSELNTPCTEQRPSIRSDGLEIFFFSNRPAPGGFGCATTTDLWVAKRDTLSQVWYTPENLGPVVNSAWNDTRGYISSDGRTLYFASDRPGGPGLSDLYVTTRNRSKPREDD
jgi:Tol biopolymer transport system component